MTKDKPKRITFEVNKNIGKNLISQDEAMIEALRVAKDRGYNKISLQDYTETGFLFLAYS